MLKINDIVILNRKIDELPSTSYNSIFGINKENWLNYIAGKNLTIIKINSSTDEWEGYRANKGTYSFKEIDNIWVFPIEWFSPYINEIFDEEDFLI